MHFLSKYGIHLRDRTDSIAHYILGELQDSLHPGHSLASPSFSNSKNTHIGPSHNTLLPFSIGGKIHQQVLTHTHHKLHHTPSSTPQPPKNKQSHLINKIWPLACAQQHRDTYCLYKHFKWVHRENDSNPLYSSSWNKFTTDQLQPPHQQHTPHTTKYGPPSRINTGSTCQTVSTGTPTPA